MRKIWSRGCSCQAFHTKHVLFCNCVDGEVILYYLIRTIEELANWKEAGMVGIKIAPITVIHGN